MTPEKPVDEIRAMKAGCPAVDRFIAERKEAHLVRVDRYSILESILFSATAIVSFVALFQLMVFVVTGSLVPIALMVVLGFIAVLLYNLVRLVQNKSLSLTEPGVAKGEFSAGAADTPLCPWCIDREGCPHAVDAPEEADFLADSAGGTPRPITAGFAGSLPDPSGLSSEKLAVRLATVSRSVSDLASLDDGSEGFDERCRDVSAYLVPALARTLEGRERLVYLGVPDERVAEVDRRCLELMDDLETICSRRAARLRQTALNDATAELDADREVAAWVCDRQDMDNEVDDSPFSLGR